jgi:hypothetical protein
MVYSYILYFGCVVFFIFIILLIFRIIGFIVIIFGEKKSISSAGYYWYPLKWLLIRYHPWAIYGFGFTRVPRRTYSIYALNAGYIRFRVRLDVSEGK